MGKYICLGLIALPICPHNSTSKIIDSSLFISNLSRLSTIVAHSQSLNQITFARDDQTEECLRRGNCKN